MNCLRFLCPPSRSSSTLLDITQPLLNSEEYEYINVSDPEIDINDDIYNTKEDLSSKLKVLKKHGDFENNPRLQGYVKSLTTMINGIDQNALLNRVIVPEDKVAVSRLLLVDNEKQLQRMKVVESLFKHETPPASPTTPPLMILENNQREEQPISVQPLPESSKRRTKLPPTVINI